MFQLKLEQALIKTIGLSLLSKGKTTRTGFSSWLELDPDCFVACKGVYMKAGFTIYGLPDCVGEYKASKTWIVKIPGITWNQQRLHPEIRGIYLLQENVKQNLIKFCKSLPVRG